MTDLAQLESQILSQIAAAGDEAALEAVRVGALGKKGSISALLATLGKMSPDECKTQGAAINLAKDAVTQALTHAAVLAFGVLVKPDQVYTEGITRITQADIVYARELGYAIKLLAIAKDDGGAIEAPGPEPVAVRGLDGGLELEPS